MALLDASAVFQFGSDLGYSGHFLEIDDLLILTDAVEKGLVIFGEQ